MATGQDVKLWLTTQGNVCFVGHVTGHVSSQSTVVPQLHRLVVLLIKHLTYRYTHATIRHSYYVQTGWCCLCVYNLHPGWHKP